HYDYYTTGAWTGRVSTVTYPTNNCAQLRSKFMSTIAFLTSATLTFPMAKALALRARGAGWLPRSVIRMTSIAGRLPPIRVERPNLLFTTNTATRFGKRTSWG